ncbi:hypothetical protein E2C01_005682 [Portunus trituberculatus]|uniref:Uncharacterized protein n=1 Tax=Portunus trituberculatus TaxID=210409 RepID=A0A5B7CV02_PORTR|nr:hypothetical protein [Portunus trituberculatus]
MPVTLHPGAGVKVNGNVSWLIQSNRPIVHRGSSRRLGLPQLSQHQQQGRASALNRPTVLRPANDCRTILGTSALLTV